MNKSNTKTNEKCPLEGELDSGDLLASCPKGRIYKIGEREVEDEREFYRN